MADRDSQRIRRIGRLRDFIQIQQPRDHVLHLPLFGFPVADYSRLDRERRVLSDVQACGRRRQHGDSTHLPKLNRRFRIHCVKHIFNLDVILAVLLDDRAQTFKNFRQTPRQRFARRELHRATSEADQSVMIAKFDHAVAGVLGAAIDP